MGLLLHIKGGYRRGHRGLKFKAVKVRCSRAYLIGLSSMVVDGDVSSPGGEVLDARHLHKTLSLHLLCSIFAWFH